MVARSRDHTVTGSYDHDRNRPGRKVKTITLEVGEFNATPPQYFSQDKIDIWNELIGEYPSDVLNNTDKFGLEVLVNLLYEYRLNPDEFSASRLGYLIKLLQEFGSTLKSKTLLTKTTVDETSDDYNELLKVFSDDE